MECDLASEGVGDEDVVAASSMDERGSEESSSCSIFEGVGGAAASSVCGAGLLVLDVVASREEAASFLTVVLSEGGRILVLEEDVSADDDGAGLLIAVSPPRPPPEDTGVESAAPVSSVSIPGFDVGFVVAGAADVGDDEEESSSWSVVCVEAAAAALGSSAVATVMFGDAVEFVRESVLAVAVLMVAAAGGGEVVRGFGLGEEARVVEDCEPMREVLGDELGDREGPEKVESTDFVAEGGRGVEFKVSMGKLEHCGCAGSDDGLVSCCRELWSFVLGNELGHTSDASLEVEGLMGKFASTGAPFTT